MKKEKAAILIIAFFAGAAVMGLEIAAARLLAPFFGASLFVWTNIIGVVMAALAVGYWWGGRLADKGMGVIGVGLLLGVAGVWAILTPWMVRWLGSMVTIRLADMNWNLIVGAFTASCLAFAVPVGLLGAINPILIRRLAELRHLVGSAAGGVAAVSTAGSIVGTFITGLYLIPSFGTRISVLSIAILLFILAFVCLLSRWKTLAVLLVACIFFSSYFYCGLEPVRNAEDLLFEGETPYHFVQVTEDRYGSRRMSFNAGFGVQTVYDPSGGEDFGYFDKMAWTPRLLEEDTEKISVLMIGLAGGEILHNLHERFGDRLELQAVEIDPVVVDLAYRYFDLGKLPITVHTRDARAFLSQNRSKHYDLIIVDAYQNDLYLPWQLTTVEFWDLIKISLTDKGIAAANLAAGLPTSKLLMALSNTAASALPFVAVGNSGYGNAYLLAGKDASFLARATDSDEFGDARKVEFEEVNITLTDDHAPVEQLVHQAFLEFYRGNVWFP